MTTQDLKHFQRKRLNPFKGLVIDVPVWTDAHEYHREQHRLHSMALHQYGIVTGLEVVAWDPPDNSVVVYPGIALDSQGNTIVVPEPQRFYFNTDDKGLARLIIQYSEVPQEMAQASDGEHTHPLYILEAFRMREQRSEMNESHIELARVAIEGKGSAIMDAKIPSYPATFEIDNRYRISSGPKPEGRITIGILAVPTSSPVEGWDSHHIGITNLMQYVRRNTDYFVELRDRVEPKEEITNCDMLCLVGHQEFQLSKAEEKILENHLERGGTLFVEACSSPGKEGAEQTKGFRTSFSNMADRLGRSPRVVERQHPLFGMHHIFAATPPGSNGQALIMENDGIIYSDADYGCSWSGGKDSNPLSREAIRTSLELGVNMVIYSHQRARTHSLKIAGR